MTEALTAVIHFGFEKLALNRIEALVMEENEASSQLLYKLGFKKEGLMREYGYWAQSFHDLQLFALIKRGFFSGMTAKIFKYTALGNDMIVIDPATFRLALTVPVIQKLCDRHFGVGADGICFGPLAGSQPGTPQMRFFNPDGSEAEKSGNGLRIFARYVRQAGYVTAAAFTIQIQNEIAAVRVLDEGDQIFAISMGQLTFPFIETSLAVGEAAVTATAVSAGNPHCVLFDQPLPRIQVLGTLLEQHGRFPNRTNVQLVEVQDNHRLKIEIWERGAGYTLASGTSACAAAGAAVRLGLCQSPVSVQMVGGTAEVTIDDDWQAELMGSVTAVYQGDLSADFLKTLQTV